MPVQMAARKNGKDGWRMDLTRIMCKLMYAFDPHLTGAPEAHNGGPGGIRGDGPSVQSDNSSDARSIDSNVNASGE